VVGKIVLAGYKLLSLVFISAIVVMTTFAGSAWAIPEAYFIENKEVAGAETETIGGSPGNAVLDVLWAANTKLQIECTTNKLQKAEIVKAGVSPGEYALSACNASEIEIKTGAKKNLAGKCEVMPITLETVGALKMAGAKLLDRVIPLPVSGIFGTVTIKEIAAGCAPYGAGGAGTIYNVEGSTIASYGAKGEEEAKEHELTFSNTCPNMRFEGRALTFELTVSKIALTGGKVNKTWRAG
jgi:hypothetical protein